MLTTILNILFIILGLALIGLVLLRRGEGGGGLGGAFGGPSGEAVFGVKAAKTLDKVIAGTAAVFLLLGTLMHTKMVRPAGLEQFEKAPKKKLTVGGESKPGKKGDDKSKKKDKK